MGLLLRFDAQHLPAFGKNWRLFLLWGIGLVMLGLFAISAATFTTLLSVVILGFLIFFSGAIIIVDTFTFWWRKWSGFLVHLIVALLYLAVGIMLIRNPVAASVSLTLLLGIFYSVVGLLRIFASSSVQMPKWGWGLFNGIITFVLGLLILSNLAGIQFIYYWVVYWD